MYEIRNLKRVNSEVNIPADKSISHRALILSSLARDRTRIEPFLESADTFATLDCLRRCGVKAEIRPKNRLIIQGCGLYYPRKKQVKLQARESGTTFRIFSGVLAGQKFPVRFAAAPSLQKRPMRRIVEPLALMGAGIKARQFKAEKYPPFIIRPVETLRGIDYTLPVPSAQVKSAILLASLYAVTPTRVYEPFISRDHTERMLREFKVPLKRAKQAISITPPEKLISPNRIYVPADFSSAAFFIVLGLILKNSRILLKNVNLNPTRCGLLGVLRRMGADIKTTGRKKYFEPYADILVRSSQLKGVKVEPKEIPLMVDEIPALCVAASFARGRTLIRGLKELKVKETDRIQAALYNLRQAGVGIRAQKYSEESGSDWCLEINPARRFKEGKFKSFSDHRTAMSAVVLGAGSGKGSVIDDIECIDKSFPRFIDAFESLIYKERLSLRLTGGKIKSRIGKK